MPIWPRAASWCSRWGRNHRRSAAQRPIGRRPSAATSAEADGHLNYEIWCIKSIAARILGGRTGRRSEAHTSELQSLMRISYAVLRLKKTHYERICTTLRIKDQI